MHAQGTLPPLESLGLRVDLTDGVSSWHALSRLCGLKELRIVDPPIHYTGYSYLGGYGGLSSARVPPAALQRLANTLPLLETLALEWVRIMPGELPALQNCSQLACLCIAGQMGQTLTVADFAFLPLLPRLRVLSLDGIGVPLIERDWMKTIGKPNAETQAEAEAKSKVAAVKPMDIEVEGRAAVAVPAATAVAAASPTAVHSAPSLLSYLRECSSLQLLRWKSSKTTLAANEAYTADRSWFKARSKLSQTMQRRRTENEVAREGQALRSLLSHRVDSHGPHLRIECFLPSNVYYEPDIMHELQLPPPSLEEEEEGREAGMDDEEAADAADASSSSADAAAPEETLAERDAIAMAAEVEEEAEWKQMAADLSAAKLAKVRRVL